MSNIELLTAIRFVSNHHSDLLKQKEELELKLEKIEDQASDFKRTLTVLQDALFSKSESPLFDKYNKDPLNK